MRIALLTLSFIVSVTVAAHARLGENPDQLVARYGQPLNEADQKAEGDKVAASDVIFQKGGIQITVTVTNGLSVSETFKKLNGRSFSTGEVQILLNANSEGRGWEAPRTTQGDKLWTRDDGAMARLSKDGTFVIKSKDLMNMQETAKKLEHQPSLDGF
jgi:hypothetical protein